MLKGMFNWKMVYIHTMVQPMCSLVHNQEREVEKAMHRVGKYELTRDMRHYKVSSYQYNDLKQAQRARKLAEFIRNKRRKSFSLMSSDMRLDVNTSAAQGRKPGEPKQKKAQKAVSIKF